MRDLGLVDESGPQIGNANVAMLIQMRDELFLVLRHLQMQQFFRLETSSTVRKRNGE